MGTIRAFIAAALAALILDAGPAAAQSSSGRWLDRNPPRNWNHPGMRLPRAPRHARPTPRELRLCGKPRAPRRAEERAVVRAGWQLMGKARRVGDVTIIDAKTANDGMCRPNGYQLFAFVGGRFAGTISPRIMNARTDGAAGGRIQWIGGAFRVEFFRYRRRDPLCCPSRKSVLTLGVGSVAGRPVLFPVGVRTTQMK